MDGPRWAVVSATQVASEARTLVSAWGGCPYARNRRVSVAPTLWAASRVCFRGHIEALMSIDGYAHLVNDKGAACAA
jgi:hypothetical protein